MYSKVALVLVYLGTQVQAQIIRKLNYLPDYLSVSYDYGKSKEIGVLQPIFPDYVISCDSVQDDFEKRRKVQMLSE